MSNLDLRAGQEAKAMEDTVNDFLLGSEVIDRKRAEIRRLVNAISGFADEIARAEPDWFRVNQEFKSESFTWVVRQMMRGVVVIQGVRVPAEASSQSAWVYDSENDSSPNYAHVELVRANLGLLLQGMLRAYPALVGRIQPILAAGRNAKR